MGHKYIAVSLGALLLMAGCAAPASRTASDETLSGQQSTAVATQSAVAEAPKEQSTAAAEVGGLVLFYSGASPSIVTNVDVTSGMGVTHVYPVPPGATLRNRNIGRFEGGLFHSPDFEAVAVVQEDASNTAADVAGWVTTSGSFVRVSELVVKPDGFSAMPEVGWSQFDASGNFYFATVDADGTDVYKTVYTGEEAPATPSKVESFEPLDQMFNGYSEDVLVMADGEVGIASRLAYVFSPSPGNPALGSWNTSRGHFGFLDGKGWVGVETQADGKNAIVVFALQANTEDAQVSNPVQVEQLSATSDLVLMKTGAVSPDQSMIAFLAGEGGDCDLYVMNLGETPRQVRSGTCPTGQYAQVLGWK